MSAGTAPGCLSTCTISPAATFIALSSKYPSVFVSWSLTQSTAPTFFVVTGT